MSNNKTFSLEDRTFELARDCRFLVRDLKFRIKISRKEANESEYWLKLLKA